MEEGVTELGWGAFGGCSAATEILLPSSLTYIGQEALIYIGVEEIVIPAGATFADGICISFSSGSGSVRFLGDAPSFVNIMLGTQPITVYYPAGNTTWDAAIEEGNYGPDQELTFIAYDPNATEPPVTEPPATEPPATEPPATEPPVTAPELEVVVDEGVPATVADADTGKLLTQEEIAAGTGVRLNIVQGSLSAEEQALVDAALNGNQAGLYLDITLEKTTGEAIHETQAMVTITLEIPEALRNTDKNISRKFYILRLHEGVAEKLEDMDADLNTITIRTDRFSAYILAYQDAAKDDSNPSTGDSFPILGFAMLMIASAGAILALNKRRLMAK